MAETFKVLGQSAPLATTETLVYTVPVATSTIVSTCTVCNRSAAPAEFRISISLLGAATADADYVYYDQPVAGNDSFSATQGWTLPAGAVVRVYASTAALSFNLFGVERT